MKKMLFPSLLLSVLGLTCVGSAFAQNTNATTMAPVEQFKVCKNMRVSIVYELGQTTQGEKDAVVASALDYDTRMNGQAKEAKKQQLAEAFQSVKGKRGSSVGLLQERKAASEEFFNALDFYLSKDHTVNLQQLNTHLSYGKASNVAVSCQDKEILKSNEMLGENEKETTHPVLFSQKL